jgi:hypothetical protein
VNEKMASGFPTHFPSPHTEQPVGGATSHPSLLKLLGDVIIVGTTVAETGTVVGRPLATGEITRTGIVVGLDEGEIGGAAFSRLPGAQAHAPNKGGK